MRGGFSFMRLAQWLCRAGRDRNGLVFYFYFAYHCSVIGLLDFMSRYCINALTPKMSDFLSTVAAKFNEKGWRMTQAVRLTVQILAETSSLLSVGDVLIQLKKQGLKANISTVYRILEKLEDVHLVHNFEHQWRRCTYPDNKTDEHHFLICSKCGGVEEIFLDYKESISDQLAREKNFLLKEVHLGFFGTCNACHR